MKKIIAAVSVKTLLIILISVLLWHGSLQFKGTNYRVSYWSSVLFSFGFAYVAGFSLRQDVDRLEDLRD